MTEQIAREFNAIKFSKPEPQSFSRVLTKRVNQYFEERNLSKKFTPKMVAKTIFMLALYLTPYVLMMALGAGAIGVLLAYLVMGLGMSGVGMGIMHDAVHGAYHQKPQVNKWLGSVIYLICGNATTWRVQHNVLHHTYTNIKGMDDDLETKGLIRLHPEHEWKKMHRYQKWYSPFVYSLLTLNWALTKDLGQLKSYYDMGLVSTSKKEYNKKWWILVSTKLLYFSLFLVLPIIFTSAAWYWPVLGFVIMHLSAGFILSFVFQLAHVVGETECFSYPKDGKMQDAWMEHQLRTTADFCRGNALVDWFVGGLNYQIEHHLFPRICHVHYPEISKIVQKTAQEFSVPYREFFTLPEAIKAHLQYLENMGKQPQLAQ